MSYILTTMQWLGWQFDMKGSGAPKKVQLLDEKNAT